MNVPFAIGGALAIAGAVVHGVAGEAIVVTKLRHEVLSPTPFGGSSMTKSMIRVTWHITTIAFLVLGSAMAACAAAGSNRTCEGVGQVAAISYTGFAVLTIVLGAQQLPKALLRHPAPLLFVFVAGFAWWGLAS